ncbi:MAG TPA: sigma-54 dependent transcriptional regulator [Candidatus Parabacteroides intestinipullorum]|uniref:Sigma-54 dependent transcriptional regulator n=1 Tax=Candidatus Parabacteroides intestinipullorum TaxID=2838723 RepID=A0A9D2BFS0_9BACT|nr:sigma-54 dependent transcriptional regulator [Candidatus Parabacteroides intestinipullorum]
MKKQGSILIVDDNRSVLVAAKMLLENYFESVITTSIPDRIRSILQENEIGVILLDMNFKAGINNGNEGLFWLAEIKKYHPTLPVVLFTAYADIELAVKGIKEGATDFVVKPWENQKLVETLQKAYKTGQSQSTRGNGTAPNTSKPMYWGESAPMRQLRGIVEKVARTDANILITGENGTGKEMLAREIHRLSERGKAPLVTVDMGAITESLFESELFGHVKGAFTDAKADRPGKFEIANHGSLFLDEIGNLSYHLQAKLLTVLQQRSVIRVGDNTPIPIDIRLICATNRDLPEMVREGHFREDLLYRVNTIHLEIPPLRERPEDIIPLARIFLEKYAALYKRAVPTLSPDAEKQLREYPWMGNIRELEHAIEKALIIADGPMLDGRSLNLPAAQNAAPVTKAAAPDATTLEEMEYQMIKAAIDKFSGNLSLAANQLGISRQTLYNKMKRFGL